MLSRLYRIALRVSMLIGVLLCAAWGLSYFYGLADDNLWNNFEWEFISLHGMLHVRVTDVSQGPRPIELDSSPPGVVIWPAGTAKEAQNELQFTPKVPSFPDGSSIALEKGDGVIGFIAPYWCLAGIAFFAPAVRWGKRFRAKRRRERLKRLQVCGRCGYDLRASTGRCPECGEPFV